MLLRYTAHAPSIFVSTHAVFLVNSLSSNGRFIMSLGWSTRCDWKRNPIPIPLMLAIVGFSIRLMVILNGSTIVAAM